MVFATSVKCPALPGHAGLHTQAKERRMQKRRAGFTLIELLIVIVIIGILAAIAIPKFGATREKAYFKAMMSDLRNLNAQQEIYYSNPAHGYSYTTDLASLGVEPSAGVTLTVISGEATGWSAIAAHAAITDGRGCAVYFDQAAALGAATTPGVVACTE
jgi:type IV pilus assembly protein PilA